MKLLSLILLITTLNNCDSQRDLEKLKIEYEAITRGSSVKITLDSKELKLSNYQGGKSFQVKAKDWKIIKNITGKINLEEMKSLAAPSTKSYTDAALIASLTIIKSDKNYRSSTFDHGNPPEELKELIEKLFSLAELE